MPSWLEQNIQDNDLKKSVEHLIESCPESSTVIERIVNYLNSKNDGYMNDGQQISKKRKIDIDPPSDLPCLKIKDVSFQSPARKKFDILIGNTYFHLQNSKTEEIEYRYTLDQFSSIGGACVPTPDKATKCFTFVLFLKDEDCIIFTTQEKGAIAYTHASSDQILDTPDKHINLANLLTKYTHLPIIQPSEDYFHAKGVSSSTGKQEDRTHVVAYLKAKDGYLFFLPTGILFGFKKPTLFFPKESLASNVITGVTQRTFDLTLTLKPNGQILGTGIKTTREEDLETVQFSMIEQSEYGRIDAYTKRLGLDDQSMDEKLKAPVKPKKDDDEQETNDKGKQVDNYEDSDENDDEFEPSDDDSDPLEYDSEAEEEEGEEFNDEMEDVEDRDEVEDEEERDLLEDESD
ncbi:hypothetical protein A0J61_08579 [Choanephora cucurbitarum]|uniref:Histone chaperone RTT106/FACT complex subunit SPT16-like middle domain-containing protein n=1 Tax=Choanephora cucurbitarum TaxID=101091 RepID=A0A1C7N2W9_9FUNG|nr:hypothetical protein A0J61_08579 [Choanephora cucurbitarum]